MNIVSGSIHFKGAIDVLNTAFPLNVIITETEEGVNIFFYGITPCKSSQEVLVSFSSLLSLYVISYDISIETEDKIKLYIYASVSGKYTCMSFDGSNETFEGVLEKFENSSPHIIAIRESETSRLFGRKIVKLDIIY